MCISARPSDSSCLCPGYPCGGYQGCPCAGGCCGCVQQPALADLMDGDDECTYFGGWCVDVRGGVLLCVVVVCVCAGVCLCACVLVCLCACAHAFTPVCVCLCACCVCVCPRVRVPERLLTAPVSPRQPPTSLPPRPKATPSRRPSPRRRAAVVDARASAAPAQGRRAACPATTPRQTRRTWPRPCPPLPPTRGLFNPATAAPLPPRPPPPCRHPSWAALYPRPRPWQ
jgi:hypothetical protein